MIAKEGQVLHRAAELLLSVILWVGEALVVVEVEQVEVEQVEFALWIAAIQSHPSPFCRILQDGHGA